MRRYLFGKRMKFTAITIYFNGAVILLAIAGYGECLSEEAKAAMSIDLHFVYNNTGLRKQFAFLYLHDVEGKVCFDNTEVRNLLRKELPADLVEKITSTWPSASNFLLAVPDKFIPSLQQRGWHAEYKLLLVLKSMVDGYRSRYQHCPEHITLGSVYMPSYENPKANITLEQTCAYHYVDMKKKISREMCPQTTFYLYVRCPSNTFPLEYREKATQYIASNGIKILFEPETSAFLKKYCPTKHFC